MKKILFTLLGFIIALSTANAQKDIDFKRKYAAGGKMLMSVDSSAKNVYYDNIFPNQPHTAFNFLPQVHNVSVRIYFRKTERPQDYRYTILENEKPIAVNKSIDLVQLKDETTGDEDVFQATTLGNFLIKNKSITILTYDIQKPLDVYKTIFYGKQIPKAKIQALSKRFKTNIGVDYSWITNPKDTTKLSLTEKDDELTIVKDKSDIDYLYYISIEEKRTGKIIFESTAWKYGGIVEEHQFLPYVSFDKSIFKKSGDYEIIIQPQIKWEGCRDCDFSEKDIEKYTARHTLSITIDQENFTKKELLIYTFGVALILGIMFFIIFYFNRKRNKKKLSENEQQKDIAKLQLNSIRSQLNPHFLFNALSGIQNLMNNNEIDHANQYLSKFARLTRNVLDDRELISLSQEKTLLDDYLQMEQLRFGFQYEIRCSENLALEIVEIPSMLLQPFVENAVKHGIAKKADDGKVIVEFMKHGNDLVLTVADNGNGFDTAKRSNGLGLQLSQNRIELLNSIYRKNHFTLVIQSAGTGTKINLTITDWL